MTASKAPQTRAASLAGARLEEIAAALNDRQRAYLEAAFAEDQRREARHRGPGALPARAWRWIEYGPVGAKWLDGGDRQLLRRQLDQAELVDQGAGATWASLRNHGLVWSRHADTGLIDRRRRRIVSLMVRLTPLGRKAARLIRGEPLTRPRAAKPLSLSALRLIAYGQAHPGEAFDCAAPWASSWRIPDRLMLTGVARGLLKRGLLAGTVPDYLRITAAGAAFDVTREPAWQPLRRAETAPDRSEGGTS